MDDILILILTLVFIIAGIFGQSKKKKEIPVVNNREEEDNPFDLQEFLEENKQKRPGREKIEKKKEKNKIQKKRRISDKKIHIKDEQTESELKETKKGRNRSRFPLKQAVIYSEILNRKY